VKRVVMVGSRPIHRALDHDRGTADS